MQASPQNPYPLTGYTLAIDGPAGAGKGTLAKSLAGYYKMKYLDTGTLYRMVAMNVINNGGDASHEADAIKGCNFTEFDFRHVGGEKFSAFVDNKEIGIELRRVDVGNASSKVAFFSSVRQALKTFQVEFSKLWAARIGVILDGRDIGTVICPNADFKIYLDASAEIRAKRRMEELTTQGVEVNFQEMLADILARDARDKGREEAPLKAADDAIIIDSSNLTPQEVFDFAIQTIEHRLK